MLASVWTPSPYTAGPAGTIVKSDLLLGMSWAFVRDYFSSLAKIESLNPALNLAKSPEGRPLLWVRVSQHYHWHYWRLLYNPLNKIKNKSTTTKVSVVKYCKPVLIPWWCQYPNRVKSQVFKLCNFSGERCFLFEKSWAQWNIYEYTMCCIALAKVTIQRASFNTTIVIRKGYWYSRTSFSRKPIPLSKLPLKYIKFRL